MVLPLASSVTLGKSLMHPEPPIPHLPLPNSRVLGSLHERENTKKLCEPKYAVEIKGIFIIMMRIMKTIKKAQRISVTFPEYSESMAKSGLEFKFPASSPPFCS